MSRLNLRDLLDARFYHFMQTSQAFFVYFHACIESAYGNSQLTIVYVPIILAAKDTPMQHNLFMARRGVFVRSRCHTVTKCLLATGGKALLVLPCQTTLA
jgi:hypothetical protein